MNAILMTCNDYFVVVVPDDEYYTVIGEGDTPLAAWLDAFGA